MRRVAVTGMGAITPIGNDVGTFWNSLTEGKCGIDLITHFDASEYKSKLAAEVRDFEPEKYMDKAEIRKSDRFTQFAVAAAAQAIEDSGIIGNIDSDKLGVYFGSGIGGFDTFINEHNNLIEKGPQRVSAMFIPKMISNTSRIFSGSSIASANRKRSNRFKSLRFFINQFSFYYIVFYIGSKE